jgi:hypothetical protein
MQSVVKSLCVTLAGMLPAGIDWLYKVHLWPRPYWVFFYDPEAIYFYSGLEILRGQSPANVDNPGTPLQLLSALVLGFVGRSPLDFDHFRYVMYPVAGLVTIAAAFLLTRTLLRGLPVALQVVALWLFFLCPQALEYLGVVSPESLYFPFAAVVVTAAWQFLRDPQPRWVLLFAGAVGLACGLKMTFLAWVPAALILLGTAPSAGGVDRVRRVGSGMVGMVLGFVLATMIIIPRYPSMLGWLWGLATRSGQYGSGPQEAPDARQLLQHLAEAVYSSKAWHLVLLASLLLLVPAWLHRANAKEGGLQRIRAFSAFAVTALVFSYALASRHMALRYLLPTGMIGVVLFALAVESNSWLRSWGCQFVLVGLSGVLLAKAIVNDMESHRNRIAVQLSILERVQHELRSAAGTDAPCVVVYGFRAPQPSLALRLLASEPRDLEIIAREFPREGHVDWNYRVNLRGIGEKWDLLVIDEQYLKSLVEPVGRVVARVEQLVIVSAPR